MFPEIVRKKVRRNVDSNVGWGGLKLPATNKKTITVIAALIAKKESKRSVRREI